jgi:putative ABC transport system permease protein
MPSLEDIFNGVFGILLGINVLFALFAVIALLLALVGLFGLAAFMAQRRTKEIGLRKIMGACVVAILSAWAIVAVHAINIARATPIDSLRYQ